MSSILSDPFAAHVTARYMHGDIIRMSLTDNGIRYMKTFTVRKSRLHSPGGYVEYQLVDSEGKLFNKGAWFRENVLSLEKNGGRSLALRRPIASDYGDVPDQTDNRETVSRGLWYCGLSACHQPNKISRSPVQCSSCGHFRDGCCMEAGAPRPINRAKSSIGRRAAKSSSFLSIPESVDDKTATDPALISDLDDHRDSFISRLVDDLFEITIATTEVDANNGLSPAMCKKILSRALLAFARKIGYMDQTQAARDVMVFVLKNNKLIISTYEARAFAKGKMAKFSGATSNDNPFVDVGIQDNDFGFQQYRSLATGHPAYKWLLDKVKRDLQLRTAELDLMHGVSGKLIDDVLVMAPLFQTYNCQQTPHVCEMNFDIAWDLCTFLEEQEFEVLPEEAFRQAITLTGTVNNAQALTTAQYMSQTWGSMGDELLAILCDAIQNGKSTASSIQPRSLADHTIITVRSWDTTLRLKVSGTLESVAEVAEAIGWLSAALRSSSEDRGILSISPKIANTHVQSETADSTCLSCEITFQTEVEVVDSELNGQCWHNLFRNPVVVKGYPIMHKPAGDTGIEMPLDVIAALARANRVTTFMGRTFIKGFNTMLLLTGMVGDVFIWHLLSNGNGERISYTDPRVHEAMGENHLQTDLNMTLLGPSRHLIGWCSTITTSVGSSKANYSIGWSGLPEPSSRVALQNVSMSAGKIATVGAAVVLGKRDKPICIAQGDNYVTQLRWIGRQFVVLYDLGDRRAWLVDGLSALLHLVLASLEAERNEGFFYEEDVEFCFQLEHLKGADSDRRMRLEPTQDATPHTARMEMPTFVHNAKAAATSMLTNRTNRALKLYRKVGEILEDVSGAEQIPTTKSVKKNKNTLQCFQDRVEQIYSTLEQVIEDHAYRTSEDGFGFRLKTTNRRQIIGWDFMDIAANHSPFYLHVTTLRATGTGWTDFTRAIHAVTLFGKGFGEILKPADDIQICSKWAAMPKGQDYLAVCASDMHEILKTKGDISCDPWRVIDDIHWHHTPDTPFECCSCTDSTSPKKGCNKVQVLAYPGLFRNFSKKNLQGPFRMGKAGAVIFGHG